MDVALPRMNGVRATHIIRERVPGVKVLTLTTRNEEIYLRESFRAGAVGYALKGSASADLLVAIRTVALGRQYVDPSLRGHLTRAYLQDRSVCTGHLSAREQDVLQLTAWGHRNIEVAARLSVSVKTVEAHKANGMRKLGLGNRIELTRFALLSGWFQEG
jgi:DNA-binding NarL/FixJ family response regulator